MDQSSSHNMYTLKVNQRAQEEKERKEKERQEREFEEKVQALSGNGSRARRPKGLKFHEPGIFQAQAEKERKEAKARALREKIAKLSEKTGVKDDFKLATLTYAKDDNKQTGQKDEPEEDEIPEIEWWDQKIVDDDSLDIVMLALAEDDCKPEEIFHGITNLVQHPAVKRPPGTDDNEVQIPMYLTKDELKKLRKQRRREEEEKKQYEIRIGMRPKPEPKLKKSNILYTMGEDVITNPSMAEIKVREQVEQRQLAHKEHNESKKLTDEERKEKKQKKFKEDLSVTGVWVTIYRILDMTSPAHKFKVSQNARQLNMSGILVLNKDINIVLVEGGPKQQRKYKHLMMDRIDWASQSANISDIKDNAPMEVDEVTPVTTNKCLLVWEGQVDKQSFNGFKILKFREQPEAKQYFGKLNLNHYWELAFNLSILDTIKDDHYNI